MASFNYMNNTAPFWDFIASLEQQGNNHPFFGQNRNNDGQEHGEDYEGQPPPPFDPWGWSHQFFGGARGIPHRGPPSPSPDSRGPPPPSDAHSPPPPRHGEDTPHYRDDGDEDGKKVGDDNNNDNDIGEGPSGSGSDGEGERNHGPGRHRRCGSRRGRHGPGHHGPRGHHGPSCDGPGHRFRGYHHGPPPHPDSPFGGPHGHHGPRVHHGPPHHGGPGRRGRQGRGGHFGGPCRGFGSFGGVGYDPSTLVAQIFEAFAAEHSSNKNNNDSSALAKDNEDFTPEADIFDTPSAYVIHISLPGAKKEDVGLNWDAEKSELSIAGVIYRPGDEEFLKTLAINERKVGPFERKIRLGTRANPAHVDADGITAKLEDGVLRVEVRKEDEGFIEIKKVDIE